VKSAARAAAGANGNGKAHPLDKKEERRRVLVKHIATHGPAKQSDLGRALGFDATTMSVLCAHHWFDKTPEGVKITTAAKEEVLKVG